MKKRYTISLMVSTAAVLAACGGGGGGTLSSDSSSNTSSSKPSVNLTGTVPGTLIEAFCEDGTYHAVNSEMNGTSQHPFVLELPANLSCRLVMTTNEDDIDKKVITPIRFNQNGIKSIAFMGNDDTDLGHIDLALSRDSMNMDANGDGVEDQPIEVVINDESIEVIEKENDPLDKDDDEIIDIYEDDDGDKINNHDDDDDDNDGTKDTDDDDYANDYDGDGVSDDEDEDDDNDGTDDEDEHHSDDGHNEIENEQDDEEDNQTVGGNTGNTDTTPAVVVTAPSAGRLLASQCAQCHRTDANPNKGFEDLIGEEIYGDLDEMKRENKRELMHLQANGYSVEQIRLIDDYFNNLTGGE